MESRGLACCMSEWSEVLLWMLFCDEMTASNSMENANRAPQLKPAIAGARRNAATGRSSGGGSPVDILLWPL